MKKFNHIPFRDEIIGEIGKIAEMNGGMGMMAEQVDSSMDEFYNAPDLWSEDKYDIDNFAHELKCGVDDGVYESSNDGFRDFLQGVAYAAFHLGIEAGYKARIEEEIVDENKKYNVMNIKKHGFEFGFGIGKD